MAEDADGHFHTLGMLTEEEGLRTIRIPALGPGDIVFKALQCDAELEGCGAVFIAVEGEIEADPDRPFLHNCPFCGSPFLNVVP